MENTSPTIEIITEIMIGKILGFFFISFMRKNIKLGIDHAITIKNKISLNTSIFYHLATMLSASSGSSNFSITDVDKSDTLSSL